MSNDNNNILISKPESIIFFCISLVCVHFLKDHINKLINKKLKKNILSIHNCIRKIEADLNISNSMDCINKAMSYLMSFLNPSQYYYVFNSEKSHLKIREGESDEISDIWAIAIKKKDIMSYEINNHRLFDAKVYKKDIDCGTCVFSINTDRLIWLKENEVYFNKISQLITNTIDAIHNYNLIDIKTKNLARSNDLISRIFSSNTDITLSILNELKQTFKFDEYIVPYIKGQKEAWGLSSLSISKNIQERIESINILEAFSPPFKPIQFRNEGNKTRNKFQYILDYFYAKEIILIPLTKGNELLGYFIAIYKNPTQQPIDMKLLDLTIKQISIILYRSVLIAEIKETKEFHQKL